MIYAQNRAGARNRKRGRGCLRGAWLTTEEGWRGAARACVRRTARQICATDFKFKLTRHFYAQPRGSARWMRRRTEASSSPPNRLYHLAHHFLDPVVLCRRQAVQSPSSLPASAAAAGSRELLTVQQEQFFKAFGYLHLKQLYTPSEIERIHAALDAWKAKGRPAQPAETEPTLTELLLEDRVHAMVSQLMQSMGEPRFLLAHSGYGEGRNLKSTMWKGFSTLPKDSPAALDSEWTEHGWHADVPGPSEAKYPRIKLMLYLTDTYKDSGAFRVLPGSHTATYQMKLKALQGHHGVHTFHPLWADGTFGVVGAELPSVALESTVGDLILFHHSLYHAVYNHHPARKLFNASFIALPNSSERLASLWRHPDSAVRRTEPSPLLAHPNPNMRALVAGDVATYAELAHHAEASHLALEFPDADISSYGPAKEHLERTRTLQWRAARNGGVDPLDLVGS